MVASTELFQLIKSLTRGEKKSFQLFASRRIDGGKNNYLKLFEAIDKQREYDEKKLKQKFKKDFSESHFAFEKNHLYKLICKSLNDYHTNTVVDFQLHEMIESIHILRNKGLIDQSIKVLVRAKSLAENHKRFIQLQDIHRMERTLLTHNTDLRIWKDYSGKLAERELEIIKVCSSVNDYYKLSVKAFLLSSKDPKLYSMQDKKELETIKHSAVFHESVQPLTFEAQYYQLLSRNYYYRITQNAVKKHDTSTRLYELFKKHPEQIKENPNRMLSLFSIHLISKIGINDMNGIMETMNALTAFLENSAYQIPKELQFATLMNNYSSAANYFLMKGDFDNVLSIINEENEIKLFIPIKIKKHRYSDLRYRAFLFFNYNLAYTFFGRNNYHKALFRLNKAVHDLKLDTDDMIYVSYKVLYIIVHYELGNFELLENLYQSFLRKKLTVHTEEERYILKFLVTRLFGLHRGQKQKEVFADFKNEMEAYYPKKEAQLDQFNMLCWLDSKIQNVSYEDVIKKKSKTLKSSPKSM